MTFRLLYSIGQDSYHWWFDMAGPLGGILVGLLFSSVVILARVRHRSTYGETPTKWKRNLALLFFVPFCLGLAWGLAVFASAYPVFVGAKQAEEHNACQLVEGRVVDFRPMPPSAHKDETFRVRNVEFGYRDGDLDPGFNKTEAKGGPIREGLAVRICYWVMPKRGNRILRLEVGRETDSHP